MKDELTKPRLLIFGSLHHCVARFPATTLFSFLVALDLIFDKYFEEIFLQTLQRIYPKGGSWILPVISLCWFLVVFERLTKDNFVLTTPEVVYTIVFVFIFEGLTKDKFDITTPEAIKQPLDVETLTTSASTFISLS